MRQIVKALAAMMIGFACIGTATAQELQAHALAISETDSLGGVIHYVIGENGTLDGRYTYHAGTGRIDTEVAIPRKRGRGLAGIYDTSGTSNGQAYTSVLTITRLGKGPAGSGAEIFDMRWDNGDRGIGVTNTMGLIVAFGGNEAGLLSELEPGHWAFAAIGWNGETPRLVGYEWNATTLNGTHRATPMFGSGGGTIEIERVGDAHRLKLPGGAVGMAISAIR